VLACRVLGHRRRRADGATLRWERARGCGATGSKPYTTGEQAQRYARTFNRRDDDELGRRPLISLLPLWLARRGRRRR
jgi:hypothetical protein